MKLIKKLIRLLIIIIILLSAFAIYKGYKLYKTTIDNVSISSKITSIRNDKDFVSIKEVQKDYLNAVIAVEDHRFYKHGVVDFISIGRAIISNVRTKELREGGSTITQQTAKNLYFISEESVIPRKIAEILVGFDLENHYSKDEILELYINTIYFGEGYYGISEASKGYYNKKPSDLTLSESAMLAGIPNAPSVYAPTVNPDLAKSRQEKIISSMVKYKYLSQDEANSIK